MSTPHDSVAWAALTAAPDVPIFRAGKCDPATGAWTPVMRWSLDGEQVYIDVAAVLPNSLINWSGVQYWIGLPNGQWKAAERTFTRSDFDEQDDGSGNAIFVNRWAIGILPSSLPAARRTGSSAPSASTETI